MRLLLSLAVAVSALAISAHPSKSQTSTNRFSSDPKAAYETVKSIILKIEASRFKKSPQLDNGKFNLAMCSEASQYLMETKKQYEDQVLFQSIGFIAANVLDLSHALKQLGYPAAAWKPTIDRYEADELAAVIRAHAQGREQLLKLQEGDVERAGNAMQALVDVLISYQKKQPSLAMVVYEPGCGAGEVSVKIVTDPKGARVIFIPAFFYELCKAQDLDPEDIGRCNRWREADDGRLHEVSGHYQYIARWNDGAVRRGKLSFGWKDDGKTITLRRP